MPETTVDENTNLWKLAKKCLLFTALAHILAAYFSIGYIHYDEHFQILEFAAYKLGLAPASGLAWEFSAHIRSAMQPAFVVWLSSLAGSLANPFTIAFILRLLSSFLGLGSISLVVFIALKWVNTYPAKRFLIISATLLWFIPIIHSHFSSENISGSLFFLGAGCIYLAKEKNTNYLLLIGGLLLGLSFVCRYQLIFMILGLAIWGIFIARFSFLKIILIALPLLFAIVIGVFIDHWFYGQWVCTFWNYYKVNLVMGRAADFGTSPWWEYFIWAAGDLIPPFSIAMMAGVFYSFYKYPKNVIALSCIPFILAHFIIGHKELRFMYPLINGLPVLPALSYPLVEDIFSPGKKFQWALKLFWGINIIMMAVSCLKPVRANVQPFSYIYQHYNGRSASLLSFDNNPYSDVNMILCFYKPSDIHIYENVKPVQADSFVSKIKGPVLLVSSNSKLDDEFIKTHPTVKLVYSSFPMWRDYLNFSKWGHTDLYKVYEVKP